MRAFFSGRGHSQLAGYAGAAGGILRSRIHPLVPIAAIDLLAVVVGLGALTLVGTIVSGQHWKIFSVNDRTKDDFTTFAVSALSAPAVVPEAMLKAAAESVPHALQSRRNARQPARPIVVWAAIPDELLFGQPVLIGGPFEYSKGDGDAVRFICPLDTAQPPHCGIWPPAGEESPPADSVAVIEEPVLRDPEVTDDGPQSHSVAERTRTGVQQRGDYEDAAKATAAAPVAQTVAAPVAQAAAPVTQAAAPVVQAATPVVQAATPVVQAAAPVAQAAAPVVQAAAPVAQAAAPVAQAAAAPAQQQVQSVTQPVTQVVGGVTGLVN